MYIGIDLGGTKIEGVVMSAAGAILHCQRVPTPQGDYQATLDSIVALVKSLQGLSDAGDLPIGLGHPGSLSRGTGRLRNSNSTCLNGQPLRQDLEQALDRTVTTANDANCFALSEAADGAGVGAHAVLGVILGTGCGSGLVLGGRLWNGCNGIAGEWGHNPLPWADAARDELPGPDCWCGQQGCVETWLSGPGLSEDFRRLGGPAGTSASAVVARATHDDSLAEQALQRYEHRLARALAATINLLDPEVIVLGGGLCRVPRWYHTVPTLWSRWIFSDRVDTRLLPARHGDSSGVRGAAWLARNPPAASD